MLPGKAVNVVNPKLQENALYNLLNKVVAPIKEGNEYTSPSNIQWEVWNNYTEGKIATFNEDIKNNPYFASGSPEPRSYGFKGSTFKDEGKIMEFICKRVLSLNLADFTVVEKSWEQEECWVDNGEEVSHTYHYTVYHIVANEAAMNPNFRKYSTATFMLDSNDNLMNIYKGDMMELVASFSYDDIVEFFEEEAKTLYTTVRYSVSWDDDSSRGWTTDIKCKIYLDDCAWLESFKSGNGVNEFVVKEDFDKDGNPVTVYVSLEEVESDLSSQRHWDMDLKFNCKKKSMKDLLRFIRDNF